MEIKGETADSIAIFWTTLNEMSTEVAGRETLFNPWMSITNEAGANHNGIPRVFGQAGVRKSRTCQFHFKQSLQRMLLKFPATLNEVKSEFEEMMLQLLTVSTISEFQELLKCCFRKGSWVHLFRWFKFTLKPPYSIACDKLQLAISDTSFWTFWLKFGHKGP